MMKTKKNFLRVSSRLPHQIGWIVIAKTSLEIFQCVAAHGSESNFTVDGFVKVHYGPAVIAPFTLS